MHVYTSDFLEYITKYDSCGILYSYANYSHLQIILSNSTKF